MSGTKRRLSVAEKESIEAENAANAASLEQARKEFECCICLNLVLPYNDPVLLQACGHMFHQSCIKMVLGEAASGECPQCRERFIAVDIKDLRSMPALWRLLQNLRVACPLDCGAWKGDVSNLENHYETCRKTQCALKCGAVVKPPATFEAHNAVCPKKILTCTNDGCSVRRKRETMPDHLSTCEHAIVRCAWSACHYKDKRMNMATHEQNNQFHLKRDKLLFLPALLSAKGITVIQTVSIEIPPDLRMPTAEEQTDPNWKRLSKTNFFVGPFRFRLNLHVSNKGRLRIGPNINDDRVHHIQIAFSERLESKDGSEEDYGLVKRVKLLNSSTIYYFRERAEPIDQWLLTEDALHIFEHEGKKTIRVEIRIYIHDFVLVGDEGPDPPTKSRVLGPADGVHKGKKWGKCAFV